MSCCAACPPHSNGIAFQSTSLLIPLCRAAGLSNAISSLSSTTVHVALLIRVVSVTLVSVTLVSVTVTAATAEPDGLLTLNQVLKQQIGGHDKQWRHCNAECRKSRREPSQSSSCPDLSLCL